MVLMFWKQYLRNTKKEDLTESIGVVPAKYPPKSQVRTSHNFRVSELGWIMRTFFLRTIGFL